MNKHLSKVFSLVTILALVLMALPTQSAQAISADVVISQVYGAGGNSGVANDRRRGDAEWRRSGGNRRDQTVRLHHPVTEDDGIARF